MAAAITPLDNLKISLDIWLSTPGWKPREIVLWCQGFTLPACGDDEEPYIWLNRAVGADDEARRLLALRITSVLASWAIRTHPAHESVFLKFVDQPPADGSAPQWPVLHEDQFLYNLLMLAAVLERPQELAEILYEFYRHDVLPQTTSWRGMDLEEALRCALSRNQVDGRLADEWTYLLRQSKLGKLPGNPYDGIYSILRLPEASYNSGRMARALSHMAVYLEDYDDLRDRFREVLSDVQIRWVRWQERALFMSDYASWPSWATQCLRLPREIRATKSGTTYDVLWWPIAPLGELSVGQRSRSLSQGEIHLARLPHDVSNELVAPLHRELEEFRSEFPWADTQGRGCRSDAMLILQDHMHRWRGKKRGYAELLEDVTRKQCPQLNIKSAAAGAGL